MVDSVLVTGNYLQTFENFPELLLTTVWHFQLISRKWKSPMRTRATNPEIFFPNCLQLVILPYYPGLVIGSGHPQRHNLCFTSL